MSVKGGGAMIGMGSGKGAGFFFVRFLLSLVTVPPGDLKKSGVEGSVLTETGEGNSLIGSLQGTGGVAEIGVPEQLWPSSQDSWIC